MAREGNRKTQRAKATRRRMLDAARELFVEHGYGSTTLQDVAKRAGVAVQTIYFTFGNKRALLKEVADVVTVGDTEPVAQMDRPWFRDAVAAPTAEAHLVAHVRGTREILERVATIVEMVRNAIAIDPEIAELWPRDPDPRFVVHATAANALLTKPGAREGVTADHAADLLYGLLSPELYLVLVRDRGWSPERWEQWAFETLRPQLCSTSRDSAPGSAAPPQDA
jgi:AcrR family transcriptional regulator